MPDKIRATIEDLTNFIPRFIPTPRIAIVRMYAPGVEPVEPNKFTFAVVAVIWQKIATIKALADSVGLRYMRAGAQALKLKYKIEKLHWRHHGVDHEYIVK